MKARPTAINPMQAKVLAGLRAPLSHLCTILLLWSCFSFASTLAAQADGPGGGPTQPTAVNLDLSSTHASLTASSALNHVIIHVGSSTMTVTPQSVLTPAEYVAASQVASGHAQALQIGANGNAVGGAFWVSGVQSPISGLVVPTGVTAIDNVAKVSNLNIAGNLVNYGNLYAVSNNTHITTGTISATNITNSAGALLTTILPTSGAPFSLTGLINNLNLNLQATNHIINSGTISSAASLNLYANSIQNIAAGQGTSSPIIQSAGSMTAWAPSIVNQGSIAALTNNINLWTDSITNSGQIQAVLGSISASSYWGSGLSIINTNGSISAAQSLNLSTFNFFTNNPLAITGGSLTASQINLDPGGGTLAVNVNNISNSVNIANATTANIAVANGSNGLNLSGMGNVTSGSLSYNGQGDVSFNGFKTNGGDIYVNTTGAISVLGSNGAGNLDTTSNKSGGDVTLISSANGVSVGNINTNGQGSGEGGNITLQAGGNLVSGTLDANGGNKNGTAGTITTTFDSNTTSPAVIDLSQLAKYAGSNLTIGSATDKGNIVINSDCNGCLGNLQNLTIETQGSYVATGTKLTLAGGTNFQIDASGGINTGSISGGNSISLSTAGNLVVDGSIQTAGALVLSGDTKGAGNTLLVNNGSSLSASSISMTTGSGDISIGPNSSLNANGGNLLVSAGGNVNIGSGTTFTSIANTSGTYSALPSYSGGQIAVLAGIPSSSVSGTMSALSAERGTSNVINLPSAFGTSNQLNISGGSVLQVDLSASKSVTNSTFNISGGVVYIDPPATNNVSINGATFVVAAPVLAGSGSYTGTGILSGGTTGGAPTGGGTTGGGIPAGGVNPGAGGTGSSGAGTGIGAGGITDGGINLSAALSGISASSSTLLNGSLSNTANTTSNTALLQNTSTPTLTQAFGGSIAPSDSTKGSATSQAPISTAVYCSPQTVLQPTKNVDENSWLIASNKCQPYSFDTADGSIIIGSGPAIFAPSSNRTLLLKEGKLLVIAGDTMLVVKTPMCNLTIPIHSAATVDYDPAGLARLTSLAGGKATISVSRNGETIILSAAPGEQLVLAEDAVKDDKMVCEPDITSNKIDTWLIRLSGVRGQKFHFDRMEMVSREELLNCTLGCFTKIQQGMIEQIRKSMMLDKPSELKSLAPNRNKTRISQTPSGNGHLKAVSFTPSSWPAASHIQTLTASTATVKYCEKATVTLDSDNRIHLKRGDILVSTKQKTIVVCDENRVEIAPSTVALVSNRGDHMVVRNVYEPKLTSAFIVLSNHRLLGIQAGQETIVARDGLSYGRVLGEDSIGRRRMRQLDLKECGKATSSEVSLMSLLVNNDILSQLARSEAADDKAIIGKIMKLAVALQVTTQGHGNFSIVGNPQ